MPVEHRTISALYEPMFMQYKCEVVWNGATIYPFCRMQNRPKSCLLVEKGEAGSRKEEGGRSDLKTL
jgi:hypothetical protein